MAADASEAERLVSAFSEDGWVTLRGAVAPDLVAALRRQVEAELEAPSIAAESGSARVSLRRRDTWPADDARRVVEVTPPGDAPHWARLASSPLLAAALDALLGPGCWEVPVNPPAPAGGGGVPVRHWYAPITFPDDPRGPAEVRCAERPARSSCNASNSMKTVLVLRRSRWRWGV